MRRIFLISDNHFSDYDGPDGIIPKLNRPFKKSADMNATMIKNWNSVVGAKDTVFNMGDFAWLKD